MCPAASFPPHSLCHSVRPREGAPGLGLELVEAAVLDVHGGLRRLKPSLSCFCSCSRNSGVHVCLKRRLLGSEASAALK